MDAFLRSVATFIREFAIPIAITVLVLWGVATWLEAPGWVHLLLTAGVFLLIYGTVVRGTKPGPGESGRSK